MFRSRPLSFLLVAALSAAVLVGCTDDPAPVATTARRLGIPETHARLLRLRAIEALAAGEEG